jgi:hypothetical protein
MQGLAYHVALIVDGTIRYHTKSKNRVSIKIPSRSSCVPAVFRGGLFIFWMTIEPTCLYIIKVIIYIIGQLDIAHQKI